jgi:hypothetical protein
LEEVFASSEVTKIVQIDREVKEQLLKVLSNVEVGLPVVRKIIEEGDVIHSSHNVFHTNHLRKLPNGNTLEGATIVLGKEATFSFIVTR